MILYKTYYIKIVTAVHHVRFLGPDIYAVNPRHAREALRHIGKAYCWVGPGVEVFKDNPNRIVELDSLIAPNNLQLN